MIYSTANSKQKDTAPRSDACTGYLELVEKDYLSLSGDNSRSQERLDLQNA